jgi:hypothetical protein
MKLSAAHDSSGSEHPDVRGQIDEEEVRMPSLMTPRAVQVTPLQLVFMNHEAPPSIAIDIQSWVRFGSGQLANIAGTLDNANLAGDFKEARMGGLWPVISAVVVACITSAPAQAQSVNRTASGQPNTDIRVGVYVNIRPDCTSGPLPSIQLTSPPENGKVTVKKAKVSATNYKQCLALQVPGFVAFYRSRADFVGVDVLTLEVRSPDGTTQVQRISVTVGTGSPGRRI